MCLILAALFMACEEPDYSPIGKHLPITREPLFVPTSAATPTTTPTLMPTPTIPAVATSVGELLSSGQSIADVVEEVLPSVVQVVTFNSTGSGFIVTTDGLVVTNHHVIEGFDSVSVRLNNGVTENAKVVHVYEYLDLAYLQIDSRNSFMSVEIRDSSEVRIGEEVIVSGGPHHQDSGEAKIRESTAGVSRKPSSDGKARGCSSKHLCGLTAWNT